MTPDRWPEIDRLYHAALERRREERAAFLDAACAGDETLRREVESLLDHEVAAEGFLERPALQEAAQQLAGDVNLLPPDPQIAGYTILKTLGEGGMGVVYLAEQTAPIRRQVALKLIKHGMDTRLVIARFDVERQALALMHHPHIAAVFDAGTTADGRPFFVMECVDGVPITEYCDRHRLSTRARLELFTDVCGAVQHAHQKGVIHRDLKPSNVLVSEQDGRPLPKIIDFGVAKAIEPSLTGRTAFTEQGTMVGTPEYMSPEQAALSQDIDTTTDVYSLGVLLYELLVGALPFDPKMLRAAGYDEMRRVIRESDPPKPSSRLTGVGVTVGAVATARQTDAGRLTRQLRGDLDWITLKALEKDRARRYATVAAFAADVAHFLADEPIAARAPSAAYRLRKFTRRYRGAVAAAAAVFVVLVAGLTVSITHYLRAEGQRNEAEYRAYTATIVAADGEIRANLHSSARARLLIVPAHRRGWEWDHLLLKSDTSLTTLESNAPCASWIVAGMKSLAQADALPGAVVTFVWTSANALVLHDGGARISLRRCNRIDSWDTAPGAHVALQAAGSILATGPAGEILVLVSTASSQTWELHRMTPSSAQPISRLGPFEAQPVCAAVSPDGRRAAVGLLPARNSKAWPLEDVFEIWDLQAARRVARMVPSKPRLPDSRSAAACLVAFSSDSMQVASSGATVHVWRSDSGAEVASDATQAGSISQPIAFDPDGTRLAIGRHTGLMDVLHLASSPRLEHLDGNGFIPVLPLPDGARYGLIPRRKKYEVLSIAFSPDGKRIVTGTDVNVGVWDLSSGSLTNVLAGHPSEIVGVAVAPDGRVVTGDANGTVKVWPASLSSAVTVLRGAFSSRDRSLVVSRDGSIASLPELDGGILAWLLTDLSQIELRAGSGSVHTGQSVGSLALSDDGRRLLVGEYDPIGTVRTLAIPSGESTGPVPLGEPFETPCTAEIPVVGPVFKMALSPDGRSVAHRHGNCLIVRDVQTPKILATLPEYSNEFVFRPDGSLFVASYPQRGRSSAAMRATQPDSTKFRIWDWRSNTVLMEVPPPIIQSKQRPYWRIALSADGRRAAFYYDGGGTSPAGVSVWEGDLTREIGRLPVPPDTLDVAVSADGARIATTARNGTAVRVWDTDRLQLLLILTDDDAHAPGIAFTPDGRLIAGRSSGGLTIWESKKKQPPSAGR